MLATLKLALTKYRPRHIRKALAAGITADLPLLWPDLADGRLSGAEVGGLAAAFLIAALAVFGIRNADLDELIEKGVAKVVTPYSGSTSTNTRSTTVVTTNAAAMPVDLATEKQNPPRV